MSMTMHIGYAISSIILLSIFFILFITQLFTNKYHPTLYWAVILATSTAGTTMSDFMNRTLNLGYATGSIILLALLIATLIVWMYTERSLSVTAIRTRRAELFYWTAILFSNTLGTALGDFLADDSGLGFSGGALLIGALLVLTVIAYKFSKISHVFLFWLAFVLTRPFGATFGDLLTKPIEKGGLNFGTIGSSLILFGVLSIMILFTVLERNKNQKTNLM